MFLSDFGFRISDFEFVLDFGFVCKGTLMAKSKSRTPVEVAVIGEVEDWEEDVVKAFGGPFTRRMRLYIDSGGGSVYGAWPS